MAVSRRRKNAINSAVLAAVGSYFVGILIRGRGGPRQIHLLPLLVHVLQSLDHLICRIGGGVVAGVGVAQVCSVGSRSIGRGTESVVDAGGGWVVAGPHRWCGSVTAGSASVDTAGSGDSVSQEAIPNNSTLRVG